MTEKQVIVWKKERQAKHSFTYLAEGRKKERGATSKSTVGDWMDRGIQITKKDTPN